MAHHKYNSTVNGVMEWANYELSHVGRIASIEDEDIQYSYAMSTVNGMLHLRQAIKELVDDGKYSRQKDDLLKTHAAVIRVIKHLIKDYDIDLDTIKKFNTRSVIESYNFLIGNNYKNGGYKTRKNYKYGGSVEMPQTPRVSELNSPFPKNVKKNRNTRNIVTKKN